MIFHELLLTVQYILFQYAGFMFIVFIAEFAVAIAAFIFRGKVCYTQDELQLKNLTTTCICKNSSETHLILWILFMTLVALGDLLYIMFHKF